MQRIFLLHVVPELQAAAPKIVRNKRHVDYHTSDESSIAYAW